MPFEPKNITRQHVLNAVTKIEQEGADLAPSTRWDVLINNKPYPPKDVMRYAHGMMNGEHLWKHNGGEPTNKFLVNLGFEIIEKHDLKKIIEDYKNYVRNGGIEDEIYKWQLLEKYKGLPDTTKTDFASEFKKIDYKNLLYQMSKAVLAFLLKEREKEIQQELEKLFDENTPLQQRINTYTAETLKIYREIEGKHAHHQDERSIATLLAVKYPDKYAFYKSSFYEAYCKFLKIKPKKSGQKYVHHLEIIKNFISEYIETDQELIELVRSKLPQNSYADPNSLLLAQDILYRSFDPAFKTPRVWRIGTTAGGVSYWQSMKNQRFAGIGWHELGDLSEVEDVTEKSIASLLKSKKYYVGKDQASVASRKSGEIFDFYKECKENDIVVAQDGTEVLGIGLVKSEYFFGTGEFSHQRKVDWKCIDPKIKNSDGLRTTFVEIKNNDFIKQVRTLLSNPVLTDENGSSMNEKMPLNQILFGPPGTGKTLEILKKYVPLFTDISTTDGLSTEQQNLLNEHTWWQLIAAALLDLKSASVPELAQHSIIKAKDTLSKVKDLTPCIWDNLQSHTLAACAHVNTAKRIHPLIFDKDQNSIWTIDAVKMQQEAPGLRQLLDDWKAATLNKKQTVTKRYNFVTFHQSYTYEDFIEGIKPVISEDGIQEEIGYEIVDGVFKQICNEARKSDKPYAIFIDEINRGNVSQIFGELITLIEPDKREKEINSMELKLPYSKKNFSVPSNVYIIGTMNTADRSVEALDIALRRRFCFKEIGPQPDLIAAEGALKAKNGIVDGIDLPNLLKTLNKRIEKILDKDHLIGHSYFMNVSSVSDLKQAFHQNIIPLLQEYFYGDYGKLGLVLGTGFVDEAESNGNSVFANFPSYSSEGIEDRQIFKIKPVDKMPEDAFKAAIGKMAA